MLRLALGAALGVGLSVGAMAAGNPSEDEENNPGKTLVMSTTQGQVQVQYFAAAGNQPRPAVMLLHGASAADDAARRYGLYADSLNTLGFDVYAVFYYNGDEKDTMASPDQAVRAQTFATHYSKWVREVREVISFVLTQHNSNGRLGLIGFSNGATLALGTAALDERVGAVVEFYGAYPPVQVTRLPPLLIIHGDADTTVPVKAARDLDAYCKSIKVPVQTLIYPHAGHGFDAGGTLGSDSRQHALRFMMARIKAK